MSKILRPKRSICMYICMFVSDLIRQYVADEYYCNLELISFQRVECNSREIADANFVNYVGKLWQLIVGPNAFIS